MLERFDPEIHALLQHDGMNLSAKIDLRPGRNYLSNTVLEALGSPVSDFYVEGFPGSRYTTGSAAAEEIERIGNARLKELFKAEEGTLQPTTHAGAAIAVLTGLLDPGDTVLSPAPVQGAQLVFGHRAFQWTDRYRFVHYGPDKDSHAFDPDSILALAKQSAPALVVVSVYPYPRQQNFAFWRHVADQSSALLLIDLGVCAGLVPSGKMPNPVEFADVVIGATQGILRGPPGGFMLNRKSLGDRILKGLFPMQMAGGFVNQIAGKAVALKEMCHPESNAYVGKCVDNAGRLSRLLSDRGFELLTGGTDFHFCSLHTSPLGLSGMDAEKRLWEAGIAVQRVQFPCSEGCSNRGDGIVLATQAMTLKGISDQELKDIADRLKDILR